MRRFATDASGQQWVDHGMGWVPLGGDLGQLWPGKPSASGSAHGGCPYGYSKYVAAPSKWFNPLASFCKAGERMLFANDGKCYRCTTAPEITCAPGYYEDSGILRESCGNQLEPQAGNPSCFRCGSPAVATPRGSYLGASDRPTLGSDGNWYAPDGLGGTLVWNGTAWCRS